MNIDVHVPGPTDMNEVGAAQLNLVKEQGIALLLVRSE